MDRIKCAMETGYFFGSISVKSSLNLLKGKDPGSFLIRLTPEGEFCISRVSFFVSFLFLPIFSSFSSLLFFSLPLFSFSLFLFSLSYISNFFFFFR